MENLSFSLTVALIGMLVVFAGLVILIVCIKAITALSSGGTKKAAKVAEPTAVAASPVPAPVATDGIPAEIVAAITAAIAAVWDGKGGFVVRHVRRVSNASAWNRAGREDQIYSRF